MIDFVFADQNLAFTVVLGLLLFFFFVELCGLLFGADLSALLGDLDLPDIDIDADGIPDIGVATKFLYWLKVGKVPLMILLVIFMTAFVLCGYGLQLACLSLLDRPLPGWLAAVAALALTVPAVRLCGGTLARFMPRDETEAIEQDELIGGRAVIVLGKARKGSPAQARTSDRFGTTHYLMVEPDEADEILETGIALLLVRREGFVFYAIKHPDPGDA